MAPVRSSCHVKQAVNQPVPCTTTFVRHQQVSTVHVCHSKLVCSAHCHASLPHHSAAGFYKAVTVQALTFTDLRPPGTPNMFVAAGPVLQIVCMCQEMRGLRCDSILGFKLLCLTPSKATDTPEDRNNPVLLYNKMELQDMITNFTLEVESQVKIYSLFVRFHFFFFFKSSVYQKNIFIYFSFFLNFNPLKLLQQCGICQWLATPSILTHFYYLCRVTF